MRHSGWSEHRIARGGARVAQAEVGAAVVKIFVTRQRPALVVPWQPGSKMFTVMSRHAVIRWSPPVAAEPSSAGVASHRHGTVSEAALPSCIIRQGDPLEEDVNGRNHLELGPITEVHSGPIRISHPASTDPKSLAEKDGWPPYLHFNDVNQAIESFDADLVLTAAHVVADARDIRVQLLACPGASPEKFFARVVAVAHDCDLALLEVRDPRCFEGATPMELLKPQEMLEMQSRVQVMGFPIGGDYLSITEGVLSRIEVVDYSHSRRSCLALTVDAAINAGNSGGPVVDPLTGRMSLSQA
ncbi:Putative protease Do-like 3 [Durusdinium trenchii]|uniref:Mitochondrial n=1 Tax=Durusdinium trenchii TaxID=1381693 RepID=A0ABP0K8S9_9DINO